MQLLRENNHIAMEVKSVVKMERLWMERTLELMAEKHEKEIYNLNQRLKRLKNLSQKEEKIVYKEEPRIRIVKRLDIWQKKKALSQVSEAVYDKQLSVQESHVYASLLALEYITELQRQMFKNDLVSLENKGYVNLQDNKIQVLYKQNPI